MSQAQFAKLLGVRQPTVCRLERGQTVAGAMLTLLESLKAGHITPEMLKDKQKTTEKEGSDA
ncbi:transcriptional regulator with XRE-family HTH domain [Rhodobium gokarnense]|uniref:Transcriptional regulator with XRE-family HTH domain n=2 Tax=Rhodobium gokarnense TaxID=364296 RepID=A0ABT3HH16_9HYPH|nr:transcriptional regulator with XRE-family HTH domain [Rhodobium gokarnense]